ncbi:MAG: peptide chain release factor N(5)-glutamine methyltransferase [Acidobacteria bacterium]|nr:peptide chain release factor N(5)-glutamine methyltransferase [Acidobacteriota bacterium]MCA1627835.1 peptide chain release factor N(5)-glutamine methyltransferase [Acidobacteriota bacterium]
MNVSIAEALRQASRALDQAGVADARREAGSLLSHVMRRDRTFLISHAEDQLDEDEWKLFENAVARRAAGEPTQYITSVQDFFGRNFRVTPDVLIPRPETELLVEAALELMNPNAVVCDVGAGSGCIAVTLLCERNDARAVAIDISEAALEVTRQNAHELLVERRIELVRSDCFDELKPETSQFDLIVSNPPYVSANMLAGLQREVRDYEPLVALSPGEDGLSVIRRLLTEAPQFIQANGHLLFEIGFDQAEAVKELVNPDIWTLSKILPDLQGIPRIVVLQKH